MAQEKNPKRYKSTIDFLREERERLDRESPVLRTRWYVIERTPSYNDDGYWGHRHYPEKNKLVSPYFNTHEEAKVWFDEHVPDEGNTLHIGSENLRKICHLRWGS